MDNDGLTKYTNEENGKEEFIGPEIGKDVEFAINTSAAKVENKKINMCFVESFDLLDLIKYLTKDECVKDHGL